MKFRSPMAPTLPVDEKGGTSVYREGGLSVYPAILWNL